MNPPPPVQAPARAKGPDPDHCPSPCRQGAAGHRLLEATRRRILSQAGRARRAQANCLASLARDLLT